MCDNTLFLCNIWFLYRASFSAALKNIDFSGFSHVFLWQRSIRGGFVSGTPDWIRTSGLQSRSLSLYPAELRAHMEQRETFPPCD